MTRNIESLCRFAGHCRPSATIYIQWACFLDLFSTRRATVMHQPHQRHLRISLKGT